MSDSIQSASDHYVFASDHYVAPTPDVVPAISAGSPHPRTPALVSSSGSVSPSKATS